MKLVLNFLSVAALVCLFFGQQTAYAASNVDPNKDLIKVMTDQQLFDEIIFQFPTEVDVVYSVTAHYDETGYYYVVSGLKDNAPHAFKIGDITKEDIEKNQLRPCSCHPNNLNKDWRYCPSQGRYCCASCDAEDK